MSGNASRVETGTGVPPVCHFQFLMWGGPSSDGGRGGKGTVIPVPLEVFF